MTDVRRGVYRSLPSDQTKESGSKKGKKGTTSLGAILLRLPSSVARHNSWKKQEGAQWGKQQRNSLPSPVTLYDIPRMTPLQWSDLLGKNDRELHEEARQYLLKSQGVVDEGQLAAWHRDSVNVPARSMLSRISERKHASISSHKSQHEDKKTDEFPSFGSCCFLTVTGWNAMTSSLLFLYPFRLPPRGHSKSNPRRKVAHHLETLDSLLLTKCDSNLSGKSNQHFLSSDTRTRLEITRAIDL
ncbi:hypothetical protein DAPPUDRAFT_98102 [Daphnia pulex]|uniref:Uncharacterized protein n=1 Tax=Daphnia pulex TaxID=6669 RepID=E9G2C8_DAPPU|nr:hypothetical protein DAPPUDRAFT_98102 [Daphnia pulex]|eukprot:EFX86227.1 hypothetical protein DAPPUDRAFT_98102 [Daphnia pulex]